MPREGVGETVPIRCFARLKPLGMAKRKKSEQSGGKRITGWDEEKGEIHVVTGGSKEATTTFDHMEATLSPLASQEHVYEAVAAPLVAKWVDGFDVDLVCYGQTGAGKTFTMFGPPMAMGKAAKALGSGGGVLKAEHGFVLRAGMAGLAAVTALEGNGKVEKAVLHGSLVEMTIHSLMNQSVNDLLNKRAACFIDKAHHLQGALQVPLNSQEDLVRMAAKVEERLVRGTKMNDTSSRSHCITVLTLSVKEEGNRIRTSRLNFFDLMGSERFKGANAAHDEKASTKSTTGGWEGIYANISLSSLLAAVKLAAKARRKGNTKKQPNPMLESCLTDLLSGSLSGSAMTSLIVCLSQDAQNADESYLSLKYSREMADLLNAPKPQPSVALKPALQAASKELGRVRAIVEKGVKGKYQQLRQVELRHWKQEVAFLTGLLGSA